MRLLVSLSAHHAGMELGQRKVVTLQQPSVTHEPKNVDCNKRHDPPDQKFTCCHYRLLVCGHILAPQAMHYNMNFTRLSGRAAALFFSLNWRIIMFDVTVFG